MYIDTVGNIISCNHQTTGVDRSHCSSCGTLLGRDLSFLEAKKHTVFARKHPIHGTVKPRDAAHGCLWYSIPKWESKQSHSPKSIESNGWLLAINVVIQSNSKTVNDLHLAFSPNIEFSNIT